MVAMSFRLSKRKIAAFFVICLTVVSGIFLITKNSASADEREVSTKDIPVSLNAKSNEQRIVFLHSFGWEIEMDPMEVVEVNIPEEFDDALNQYNEIQKQQNMDLEKYSGKRVKRYTYVVTNHPSGDTDVRANVLVFNNKIIGGDVCTVRLDGFMHGFEMGETQANTITYNETDQQVAAVDETGVETVQGNEQEAQIIDGESELEITETPEETLVNEQETDIVEVE